MSEDGDGKSVVDLLSDDYAWQILETTSEEAKSVKAISDACGADRSTIYRRLERLEEADFVDDQQELDPDGHHYKSYAANLEAVTVRLEEEGFDVEVVRPEQPADRFTRLYEGFK
ncbi:MAG: ArsR/SmtB family transcription factor [Halobaculum sp.]|jgi:predicted transcriptional regulator